MLTAVVQAMVLVAFWHVEPPESGEPVHVAPALSQPGDPPSDPMPGSVEWTGENAAATLVGFDCKAFDRCPRGSIKFDGDGFIVGCSTTTAPPGCTGTCTACEGGATAAQLCVKKVNKNCELATTGSGQKCGKASVVACGFVAGGGDDWRGCTCPLPPAPTFSGDCELRACVAAI